MRRAGLALWFASALVALAMLGACSGEKAPTGLHEPLRVKGGSFREGPLPGAPPVNPPPGPPPSVTTIESPATVVRPGQTDKSVLGHVSKDAVAIAVAFDGLGSGYWVMPVGAPDPAAGGELTWQLSIDVGEDVPPGLRELRVVAVDAAGNAGSQRALPMCIASPTPDNLAACNPKAVPPAVVVSLSWDTAVDLDLVVVAPDGRVIDAKHPRTTPLDAGADAEAGTVGIVNRDSNGGCVLDRIQREDLVWQTPPAAGSYLVYANLFDACGRAPVHFHLSVHERQATEGGGFALSETVTKDGLLLALDANGGAKLGTFVTELAFQ